MSKTTEEEIQEAEALTAASHLATRLKSLTYATQDAEKDPTLAAEAMEDLELADAVALLQDIRHRLGLVERDLTTALGKRVGKYVGNLSDGRQFTVQRSADRKEWNHEDWKRDVRRKLVDQTLHNLAMTRDAVVVDPNTGMESDQTLASILQGAMINAQEIHGSTDPRSRSLKGLGLFATDYCTSTPAGWRFNAIKPTTATTEDTTDA